MIRTILPGAFLAMSAGISWGHDPGETDLFRAMEQHDATFFERGFNRCDLDYLQSAVHPRLDFYHDRSGYQDRAAFFDSTRKYICSGAAKKPIRKVEPGSLAVFPLYKSGVLYGVIQSGAHHFHLSEPGKEDVHTGSARFTHLYLLENGHWLLKEVLSYDHREPGIHASGAPSDGTTHQPRLPAPQASSD